MALHSLQGYSIVIVAKVAPAPPTLTTSNFKVPPIDNPPLMRYSLKNMCSNPLPSAPNPIVAIPNKLSRPLAGFFFRVSSFLMTKRPAKSFPPREICRLALQRDAAHFPHSRNLRWSGEKRFEYFDSRMACASLRVRGGGAEPVQLYTILIQSRGSTHKHSVK